MIGAENLRSWTVAIDSSGNRVALEMHFQSKGSPFVNSFPLTSLNKTLRPRNNHCGQ